MKPSRACLTGILLLVACATEPKAPAAIDALPRALTSQETAVIDAANKFSLELFKQVSAAEPAGNVFISPLSASMALGMTMNGARGTTQAAMRTALQFGDLAQPEINASYQSLISLLTGLDPTTEMKIANSLWYHTGFAIDPAFVTTTKNFFDARVAALDFTQTAAATAMINGWVKEQTGGRIPSMLDDIASDEVAFLVNAIYFRGSWRTAFDRANTREAPFRPATGAEQKATMMHLEKARIRTRYMPDGAQMAELPYGNTAFNMVIVLPRPDVSLDSYIETLTPALWNELTAPAEPRELDVYFPRLRLEYKRVMNPDLTALGMGIAFTDVADFSGMSSTQSVAISKVMQKTFVEINEEGTEAAAATSVGMRLVSLPPSLICNRPYLIAIRERLSGTIVFIGKINTM